MTRVAIYARFSTDNQDRRSIDAQVALGRADCAAKGWKVMEIFADEAISGSSLAGRPNFARMVAKAQGGQFDLLWAEDIERWSRNLGDIERFREQMEFIGVKLWTHDDGEVIQINAAIKGLSSGLMLKGHRERTRNRMAERVREGFAAGGRCYGYESVKVEPGRRVIIEAEAEIVRRIFAEYLAGKSPRAIAADLNRDGIKAPRKKFWRAGTINGSGKRACGILRNSIYAGKLTWNRVGMVKKPGERRRISRPNDVKNWITRDVPELAIIAPEQFAAVQARKAALSHHHPGMQKRPRHILSGLLRCAACGSGMSVYGADKSGRRRIRCTAAKEGDACPAPSTFYLDTIETTVLARLREELRHPDAISAFVRGYHDEQRKLAAGADARRATLSRRLAETIRARERVIDAIAAGHGDPAVLGPRASEIDADRRAIEAELGSIEGEPKVISLHPAALKHYEKAVADFQRSLGSTVREAGQVANALSELVESVTISRNGAGETEIIIAGRLNSLCGIPAFPEGVSASCLKAVAGERLGHLTHLKSLRFELRTVA